MPRRVRRRRRRRSRSRRLSRRIRRRGSRYRRFAFRTQRIARFRGIFPYHAVVTLPYSFSGTAVLSSPDRWYTKLFLNGPWDPVVALGGKQPVGFDMWAGLYSRMTTLSARYRVDFQANPAPSSGAANDPYGAYGNSLIFCHASVCSPSVATFLQTIPHDELVANPQTRTVILNGGPGNGSQKVIRGKVNMSRYFKKKILTATEYDTTTNNNPNNNDKSACYLLVAFSNPGFVAFQRRIQYNVRIWFTICFRQPSVASMVDEYANNEDPNPQPELNSATAAGPIVDG